MSLSDRDYQDMAQAIVADYTQQNIPLRDSLLKLADDQGFNVHETRRLLETTNVHAHLALFKEASDQKYVEFSVIDPKDVCGELFGRVDTPDCDEQGTKVASITDTDLYMSLPDEYAEGQREEIEKVAAAQVPQDVDLDTLGPYEGINGYYAESKVNKVARELENKVMEKYIDYQEAVEKLASMYQSIYADDFTELEKDAYAMYGDDAAHLMHSTCAILNREPSAEKVANHYAIKKPAHEKLAHAMDVYFDLKEHINGLEWFREEAAPLLHS